MLSREDQQLLSELGFKQKLVEIDQAILANAHFIGNILQDPEIFANADLMGNDEGVEGSERDEGMQRALGHRYTTMTWREGRY